MVALVNIVLGLRARGGCFGLSLKSKKRSDEELDGGWVAAFGACLLL